MNKDDIKKQELEAVKEQDLENVNAGVAVASSGVEGNLTGYQYSDGSVIGRPSTGEY